MMIKDEKWLKNKADNQLFSAALDKRDRGNATEALNMLREHPHLIDRLNATPSLSERQEKKKTAFSEKVKTRKNDQLSEYRDRKEQLAKMTDPAEIERVFDGKGDWMTCCAVAENPHTPESVIRKLRFRAAHSPALARSLARRR